MKIGLNWSFLLTLALLCAPALAQEDDSPGETNENPPKVATNSTKAGPIEFHIVPQIGAGVFLEDDQVVRFGGTNGFFLFRIPGLRFPGMNDTVTGVTSVIVTSPGLQTSLVATVTQ